MGIFHHIAAGFYEIWHTRSAHRRNNVCQIFSRSVKGLRISDTPKIAISQLTCCVALTTVRTTVLHCDFEIKVRHEI